MGFAERLLKMGGYKTRDPAAAKRLGDLMLKIREYRLNPDKLKRRNVVQKTFSFSQGSGEAKPEMPEDQRRSYIQKKLFE